MLQLKMLEFCNKLIVLIFITQEHTPRSIIGVSINTHGDCGGLDRKGATP
jgi:hypothetical protein